MKRIFDLMSQNFYLIYLIGFFNKLKDINKFNNLHLYFTIHGMRMDYKIAIFAYFFQNISGNK